MYFGVDYYPEHWEIDMIERDLDRMVDLGINIVRIGEFAWHLMESEDGKFDFSFFDMAIEKIKSRGLKIMFGTPTATFPAWLAKKYPSILSEDEDGVKMAFGGRRQYCYNSYIYRRYTKRLVKKLIDHYKDESEIIAWQIDNEFGHEGSDICYCRRCRKKFQIFLKKKYNTIDKLNEIYGTIFWGQSYNDFSEIPIPTKTITSHNPTLSLDWIRFRSESINEYSDMQIDLVRKGCGKEQQVTHNLPGGFFGKRYDQQEHVRNLDFVSYDNYPVWGGLKKPISPEEIALGHDYIRGLKEKNFWIVEQLIGIQGHRYMGYLPRKGQGIMWAYQGVAHGCENIMWFRWRGMTRGIEQFCYGILDHDDKIGQKYYEVKEFIDNMKNYSDIVKGSIRSDIGIFYDFDNTWSWDIQPQSEDFSYLEAILNVYRPFYKRGLNIDVVNTKVDFTKYKVIVLPVMQVVDDHLQKKVDEFTKKGGVVVFSYRSGIKDRDNNIHFGVTPPCKIKDMCGIEISEFESLERDSKIPVSGVGKYKGVVGDAFVWRDILTLITGESLFEYEDRSFKKRCAISKNKYNNSSIYYIGAEVSQGIMDALVDNILDEVKLEGREYIEGVEVYKRELDGRELYFLINHSEEKKVVEGIELEGYEVKLVDKL